MENLKILQFPYLKFYESYKNQAIYNPELSADTPEMLRDIKQSFGPLLKRFLVNTDWPIVAGDDHLRWIVFQHIRKVGELLAGIYETDNEEFNIVFPIFIKDFFFGEVWVGYSEELLEMERESLKDPKFTGRFVEQDGLFESKFRLFNKYIEEDTLGNKKFKFSSAITGLTGYEIDMNKTPLVKCSFNNGMMFWEIWQIHLAYETGKQQADWLFFNAGKKMLCRVKDPSAYYDELAQLRSPGVAFAPNSRIVGKMNHWEAMEVNTMQEAREAYDYVLNKYNDEMARFGLGGDNDSKAERITTGENFRALQPNMAFQNSVLQKLRLSTERFKQLLGQSINFYTSIVANDQGIPQTGEFEQEQVDNDREKDE